MHLLSAIPGTVDVGSEAVDLSQSPADIVFMTSADTEVACLAKAHQNLLNIHTREVPTLRVCNMLYLGHPYSFDLYLEKTACHTQIIVARVLGGKSYFEYGIEELSKLCHQKNISLVLLHGKLLLILTYFLLVLLTKKRIVIYGRIWLRVAWKIPKTF